MHTINDDRRIESGAHTTHFRVARFTNSRIVVLAIFDNREDAVDMVDRAKFMSPFVLVVDERGVVEIFTATTSSARLSDLASD